MNLTVRRLNKESENALILLARCKIQTLMSGSSDVHLGSSIIEVYSVSIPIDKNRFVVIESGWGDTPKEYLDFHCLSVHISDAPKNIEYNPKPSKNHFNYQLNHLSLHLGAKAPVATIEVLEASECGWRESVVYDAGLLITGQDGLRLAIVRTESISGSLQIAHTAADIQSLTDGLTVRSRYGT